MQDLRTKFNCEDSYFDQDSSSISMLNQPKLIPPNLNTSEQNQRSQKIEGLLSKTELVF